MTVYYLDPIGGNDANDGLSFANRWKTLLGGGTAARLAPGAEVRCMATPAKATLGNATWTNGSSAIELAAAKTLTIWNATDAWTAAEANVTPSFAAGTYRKMGASTAYFTVGSTFTTGKLVYKTLPAPLDLSAFEQVFCWFRVTSSAAYTTLNLQLCSDDLGDVVVHTIPIRHNAANVWGLAFLDNGAPLSNDIRSISVVATGDPSTTVLTVQNIIACGPSNDPTTLTPLSLVKKAGDDDWYTVQTIDGTTVVVGGSRLNGLGSSDQAYRTYKGTTETVSTEVWNPLNLCSLTGNYATVTTTNEAGTAALPNKLTGGWDTSNMSTQTGETFWAGCHVQQSGFLVNHAWWDLDKISFNAFQNYGVYVNNGGFTRHEWLNSVGAFGAGISGFQVQSVHGLSTIKVDIDQIHGCDRGVYLNDNLARGSFDVRRIDYASIGFDVAYAPRDEVLVRSEKISNNRQWGVSFAANSGGIQAKVVVRGATLSDNTTADVNVPTLLCQLALVDCELLSTTPYSVSSETTEFILRSQRHNKTADDHRMISPYHVIRTDPTVRHTESDVSWRLDITALTYFNQHYPAKIPLGKVACEANTQVTIICWMRRAHASLECGLRVRGGSTMGIDSDVVVAMTAAVDTWEEVTLTFTPTDKTVVEVEGWAYGIINQPVFFDDLYVSQA